MVSVTSCAAMIRPTATLLLDASASTRGAVRARAIVVKVRSAFVTAPPAHPPYSAASSSWCPSKALGVLP